MTYDSKVTADKQANKQTNQHIRFSLHDRF